MPRAWTNAHVWELRAFCGFLFSSGFGGKTKGNKEGLGDFLNDFLFEVEKKSERKQVL